MLANLLLAIAIINILYGIVIVATGSGTLFFLVWFVLGGILTALSFAARAHLFMRLPGVIKALLALIAIAGITFFVIINVRIYSGMKDEAEPDLDFIIVLGAQVYENGPSNVLKFRLDAACDYLSDNPRTVCIVSGGQGFDEPACESVIMKEYLVGKGIPEARIIEENRAESTVENIRFSMELIGSTDARIGIVTNDFHVYRALSIAKKQGLENAVGICAGSSSLYFPHNMLRETLVVFKDTILGNMK